MIYEAFEVEFQKLVTWYKRRLDAGQVDMWFDRIKHIPTEAFSSIVVDCIDNMKYFPTPNEVKELYLTWLQAHPEKRVKESWDTMTDCPECRGAGYFTYWHRIEGLSGFKVFDLTFPYWYSSIAPCAACQNWKRVFPTGRNARPKKFYTRETIYRDGRLPRNPAQVAWERQYRVTDGPTLEAIAEELTLTNSKGGMTWDAEKRGNQT